MYYLELKRKAKLNVSSSGAALALDQRSIPAYRTTNCQSRSSLPRPSPIDERSDFPWYYF
jgi:hypothetical protein